MVSLLKHVPSLYVKNVDFATEIKRQTMNLEIAKELVRKFYFMNSFFYRNAMVGGIISSREDYDVKVDRFASKFDALSKNSQKDILEKFQFVGWSLGRSLTKHALQQRR